MERAGEAERVPSVAPPQATSAAERWRLIARPRWKLALRHFPPVGWLAGYGGAAFRGDLVAGLTLAAYAIPVSIAYAGIAGLPPQAGIYGYLLGGVGYALFGSSRQLAIGPTSAISLMIAATAGTIAGGDVLRYAQIASLTALAVAGFCVIAWALRLSLVVKLISDSILVGFKIGAGLTIAVTQLPSLLGIPGSGRDFIGMAARVAMNLSQAQPIVMAVGFSAIVLLLLGGRLLPGRPVALAVVALSIVVATALGLPDLGVPTVGKMVSGLPVLDLSMLRLGEIDGIVPLAGGCVLLSYIESVSAGRAFAAKHGYAVDTRQELLGLAAANVLASLGHGYPVAGGLSQSAVNDKAGARTPLALVLTSVALGLCLMFFAGALENLPKAVLAAVVMTAILGLIDVRALLRAWRVSRIDFFAAVIALGAVLLLGILQGLLFAVMASIVLVLIRAAHPHVAFLGRIPGTNHYSDIARHPENERLPGVLAFRPETPIFYVNADAVLETVLTELCSVRSHEIRTVVCDLSASPDVDLAGARMLRALHGELASRGIKLRIVGAHGHVRDLLRADGIGEQVGELHRLVTLDRLLAQPPDSGIGLRRPNGE